MNDETLLDQLKEDLQALFSEDEDYGDLVVKTAYDGNYDISYPLVVIRELDNYDNSEFYDGKEHIVDVAYQFNILAGQTATLSAEENVRNIITKIRDFMRGERYHALERLGSSPIVVSRSDRNIMIGFMRYEGCIDIDTNTIYRRR
jgi:hypothetical protein